MMLVQQIKKEIAGLPKVQLKEFRSWFEEFDASEWEWFTGSITFIARTSP